MLDSPVSRHDFCGSANSNTGRSLQLRRACTTSTASILAAAAATGFAAAATGFAAATGQRASSFMPNHSAA
jgi:hypothetical protein